MRVIKRMLKGSLLIAGMLVMMSSAYAQNTRYISNHKAIAILLSHTYGIPASVILAVAAVESSGGLGPAARVLNNHFGIVGKNEYVTKSGFRSRYKQYPNELASYIDFCKMLTRKHFYHRLKNTTNSTAWIKAMSNAHYSEVPEEWEQKVFSVLAVIKKQARKGTSALLALR